jgi:hypothetical protein
VRVLVQAAGMLAMLASCATMPPAQPSDLSAGATIAQNEWPALAADPAGRDALSAGLEASLLDDPTNLVLAERLSLLKRAAGLRPGESWTAALTELRAEQDGLRMGGNLPDDATMSR